MVYSPGIDWAERIMYDFPEAEWEIEEEIYDADYLDLEIKEYCASGIFYFVSSRPV